MKNSFHLTTVFKIPIEINSTWFIVFGLVVFTLAQIVIPSWTPGLDPLVSWLIAVLTAILFFASLLAHELSHSLVAIKNNLPINGITLFIFGGIAHMEKEPQSPSVEFKMAIAGPLMSFFLAAAFLGLRNIFVNLGMPDYALFIASYLSFMNLAVGTFNMIPGFPLDGGRVLRATLWHFTNDLRKATAIATGIGKSFAYFLIGIGLLFLFNMALLPGVWLIFIGLFLQQAADSSYRQVVLKKLLGHTNIAKFITRDVVTVPANMYLDELIDDYFFKYRHHSFPVVENDQILGILTLHDVKHVPKAKWAETTAKQVVQPLYTELVIHPKTPALEAMSQLARNGMGRALVIDNEKLVGIISQKDIMRLFEFKSEIER